MDGRTVCIDGNEAAARVAHALSEVIAIYPITPASPMGELADAWSVAGDTNLWGGVPDVIEMQSEGGAAGALHGALQKGALATTFTASQGLLLMIPNFFKIAGELLPCAVHVAARSVATHALSIFGDHSDVMAARTTGFAMLASASVQEAHDLAAVAHAATLRSRVPFLHFFDGFRTSHEIGPVALLGRDDLAALVDEASILAHRGRRLTPDRPVLRGSAQNPDVFFQAREACNPFYDAAIGIVSETLDALAARSGRRYGLVDYEGAPDAERVVVLMGSGAGAAGECVRALCERGEKVGLVQVRLFRPFPEAALLDAIPASARDVVVLDRTKEPGATGEPLHCDVISTLARACAEGRRASLPRVIGGRYGLSSKEFTPAMVKGVFDAVAAGRAAHGFTVGIVDDVTHRSLPWDPEFRTDRATSALFYGLGSDGTVGSTKSSVKIIGENTELCAQGYFVYDSKKSGAMTVSHLRFSPEPIRSTYLVERADFVACHHFGLLERVDVLERAKPGGTFLLNSPYGPDAVWEQLPRNVQQRIVESALDFWVIDANTVARGAGMGGRINTVMQPCFFSLSGVLPQEQAMAAIRESIERAYGKRGRIVVRRNLAAVDAALGALHRVEPPTGSAAHRPVDFAIPDTAPDFVKRVTAVMMAGEGDRLPVSALPPDGTFPTGTARFEKRALADEIPVWDPEICIDCGKCAIVCPHAAIRMKVYDEAVLGAAPAEFASKPFRSRDLPGHHLTIQVAPDDCTGCGVCVETCPARSKSVVRHKAINMEPVGPHRARERARFAYFETISDDAARAALAPGTVKNVQTRVPLFEFSGACAGCGETPYLKLLTQLFGDRLVVANATGCSSIYGGNLPTTPWSRDANGRGPAWANSLFEDNAEFGLGMRIAQEAHVAEARRLLAQLAPSVGEAEARAVLETHAAGPWDDAALARQRLRVAGLRARLEAIGGDDAAAARRLISLVDELVDKSFWIVGGDGWAYDIGSAGLDHVLASGRDVNVLVLDTQVYSNTGGQASKATPRAAVAKFAAGGKPIPRKDLGMIASAYGNVYVAQVALGADDAQTLHALREAAAWPGPSLVVAYSTCIAHGIDMRLSMERQRIAVESGFWPLYRYQPHAAGGAGEHPHPLHLDSRAPKCSIAEFARGEGRFAMLERSDPQRAARLIALAQADADERLRLYRQMSEVERSVPADRSGGAASADEGVEPDA